MGVSKGVKFLKQIFWVVVSSILASYEMIKVWFRISKKIYYHPEPWLNDSI